MNIIKSLHTGILHKTFSYNGKHFFASSLLWGFRLDSCEPVLEQELWSSIGDIFGQNEMFDFGMPKDNGEFLVHGSFFSPEGQPVKGGKVSIRVGEIKKELSVQGNRSWLDMMGANIGVKGPEPFVEMPVSYENSFGGDGYKKNPVGKGFVPVETETGKVHHLPNIEYINQLVGSPSDTPEPAGLGRVDIMWEPRASQAGTYDEEYMKNRMPGFPDDIQWSYFSDGPPDQKIKGFFTGNEEFEIKYMNPHTPLQKGNLPDINGRCFINHEVEGVIEFKEIKTKLDTVWFFPKDNLGVIIHRGTIEVAEDDGTDVKQLLIAHENIKDKPRSVDHYKKELTQRIDPDEGFKYMLYTAPLIPEGCKCGFEIIMEESEGDNENLLKKNADTFSDRAIENAEKEIVKQKDEVTEKLEGSGIDSKQIIDSMDIPKQKESPEEKELKKIIETIIPGSVSDPDNIDLSRINLKKMDDLKEYGDKLKEEKLKEAGDKRKEALEIIKGESEDSSEFVEVLKNMEEVEAENKKKPVLPRFDSAAMIENIKKQYENSHGQQMMVYHSMGLPEDQIPKLDDAFDMKKIEDTVTDAEVKVKDGYRLGAHAIEDGRSPHEGKEEEIKTALLAAYKKRDKTSGGDYAYLDLSGMDLTGIDLSGCYLEYVDFTDTILKDANLENAILAHANLTNTDFTNADLKGANIGATIIKGTKFLDADLTDANLSMAKIDSGKFVRCKMADKPDLFIETEFNNVDFTGSDLSKSTFLELDISGCCFKDADLTESNFIKPVMRKCCFDGAKLDGINFIEAEGENSSFNNAEMRNVRFVGVCVLSNSDFTGAKAVESNFRDCDLSQCDFSDATITRSDFGSSDLTNSIFKKTSARLAQFIKADLTGANLTGIDLMEGSMMKAKLVSTDFSDSNLYSVSFLNSTLGETDFSGAYLEQTILKDWRPV